MYGKLEVEGGSRNSEESIRELRRELHIWHRTAQVCNRSLIILWNGQFAMKMLFQAMPNMSREETEVRVAVENKIEELREELEEKGEGESGHLDGISVGVSVTVRNFPLSGYLREISLESSRQLEMFP